MDKRTDILDWKCGELSVINEPCDGSDLWMFYWLFFVDIGAYDWFLSNKLAVIVVINLVNASLEFRSTHTLRQRQGSTQK
jgi:hypothetical protein